MTYNFNDIKCILPYKYPFLFIDKIISIDCKLQKITAQKNVSFNEEFFNGHFSNFPIMPGVLILEAMAQTTSFLGIKMLEDYSSGLTKKNNHIFVLAGIDNYRIKKSVHPGDVLIINSHIQKIKHKLVKSDSVCYVDNNIVAKSQILAFYRKT